MFLVLIKKIEIVNFCLPLQHALAIITKEYKKKPKVYTTVVIPAVGMHVLTY